ncbi:alanine racemase [Candidatus Bathyarchaeota archaeon]|nr:alanine racemase [Candidatus Bathyarchaeota archaeon]
MNLAEAYFLKHPSQEDIKKKIEGFPAWLEIDLDALTHNIKQVQKKVGVELVPCVKSNAYGHGLVPVVAHMMTLGIKRVLVAKLYEAQQLREAGLDCGIINMDPLFSDEKFNEVVDQNITQTVYLQKTADKLDTAAKNRGKIVSVWIKIDTGLGRVGVRWNDAIELIKSVSTLPNLKIEGLFSTLSENLELDKIQLERMKQISAELDELGIKYGVRSMASSNAIFHEPDTYLEAVRPGIMLYGLYPEPKDREKHIDLKQCFTMKARIEQIKTIEPGESLTYSKRFTATKKMRVGTLHIGYSDGFPRGLTQKGKVKVGDHIKPVLGTVSVNHTLIDLDDTKVEVGSVVEAISQQGENDAAHTAETAGIMIYSLMVGMNFLLPRVFIKNNKKHYSYQI